MRMFIGFVIDVGWKLGQQNLAQENVDLFLSHFNSEMAASIDLDPKQKASNYVVVRRKIFFSDL